MSQGHDMISESDANRALLFLALTRGVAPDWGKTAAGLAFLTGWGTVDTIRALIEIHDRGLIEHSQEMCNELRRTLRRMEGQGVVPSETSGAIETPSPISNRA
jgi:hypothetical protein